MEHCQSPRESVPKARPVHTSLSGSEASCLEASTKGLALSASHACLRATILGMAHLVLTTKPEPAYDDLPEFRYHFPKTYLNVARTGVGDLIIYYEPRRDTATLERA